MRFARLSILTACIALLLAADASARILRVPGEYGNIGAGVQAARDNDTVLVANGTYTGDGNVNVVIQRRITVMSEQGPTECIIDGEANPNMRAFQMATGSKIIGFTITRMTLYCILDSATQNTRISNCVITQNVNRGNNQGVGIKAAQASGFQIDHCIFDRNAAGSAGGALFLSTSVQDAIVWDCIFIENETTRFGGALLVTASSDADIGNCIFQGNFAGIDGGAVAFTNNAGGLIRNCTFVSNTARNGMGGGVYKGSNSNPTVINSIFWENAAATGNNLCAQNNGGSITISYCLVQGARNNQEDNGGWNGQNIIADPPEFVEGREPEWGLNWYYLDQEGAAVDAGSANASEVGMDTLTTHPELDLDEGRVDLGFHYDPDSYRRVGEVRGNVTLAINGSPLFGARVVSSRHLETFTNDDGNYRFPEQRIGPFTLTFSREGCLDSTVVDTLEEGEEIVIDVALLHTEFSPSAPSVDQTVTRDSTAVVNFSVRNDGSGVLTYSATPRLTGEADRDPWGLRQSYNWGQAVDDDRLQGFVLIDTLYYVAGANGNDTNMVYRMTMDGAVLDSFPQLGTSRYGFKQLAYDGQLIWSSGDTSLYGFTTNGELVTSWRGPFSPVENVAWDAQHQILWLSGITTAIVGYDVNGSPVDGMNLGYANLRKYGLEYWPDDPDGYCLYILHRPSGNLNNITKINIDTRDTMRVTTVRSDGELPMNDCKIWKYDLFSVVFASLVNVPRDQGNDRFDIWQLAGNTAWMNLTPRAGEVMPGVDQGFELILDMMGFPADATYEGQLLFTHNALDGEYRMPIFVTVNRPIEPSVDEEISLLPKSVAIESISPNPFNGMTRINFALPQAGVARISVFDLAGREVARLLDDRVEAGHAAVAVDASGWPSGLYIVKLTAAGTTRTAKMTLMR